jgi:phosphomannomutase
MQKRVLALFDVDQTLTIARSEISKNMKDTLKAMTDAGIHFGIVSGSDLPKITE